MEILARTLAEDSAATWSLVFIPDDLHLYVGRATRGSIPDPIDGQNIEDFLVWLPQDALHKEAHGRFIEMLKKLVG